MTDPGEARAAQALWLAVLETALRDALQPRGGSEGRTAQRQADGWFRHGPDLLTVASLAGIDGHALRQRYLTNQIKIDLLTASRQVKHAA